MSFSDPIEINKKHVLFLVVIVMLYVYLNDALKNPSYQSQFKQVFNDTIPENSTIYEWLSFRTSQISGLISVTTISVIGGLPQILRNPKQCVVALGLGFLSAYTKNVFEFLPSFFNGTEKIVNY